MSNVENELVTCINEALSVSPHPVNNDYFWIDKFLETDIGKTLLSIFKRHSIFDCYNGPMHHIANGATASSYRGLAYYLLAQSSTTSIPEAVTSVMTFPSLGSCRAYAVMFINGLTVEGQFSIGGDVKIMSLKMLPVPNLAFSIQIGQARGLPSPSAHCALVYEYEAEDLIVGDNWRGSEDKSFEIVRKLETARLCLSVAQPSGMGPQSLGTTFCLPENIPSQAGQGWTSPNNYIRVHIPKFLVGCFPASDGFFEKFLSLDPKWQKRLLVPLTCLNKAVAYSTHTDQAIAIRTALECLFLDGPDSGEFTHRLGIRAARYTENEVDERIRVRKLCKQLYGLCSRAIHNGSATQAKKHETPEVLIDFGLKLIVKGLNLRVSNPDVDWPAIELN